MDFLKLAALDQEDLTVISACMQDAVVKTGEIVFKPKDKRLIVTVNRFAWEKNGERLTVPERHRAVLHFDRVLSVQSNGIDRKYPEHVQSILAIQFIEDSAPAGVVEIQLAGGATIRASVECIEAQLSDLGAAWAAKAKPKHSV
jgi:Protein of unknown function (DUF2948)